jgi:hypothetical protein
MVASLTFRTSDVTRWGGGLGSDLSAVQVDLNFWTLFAAVDALEATSGAGAGIDFINQPSGGNVFFIHLTDHRVLGPFTIPTAQWNPRGAWAPTTNYAAYDVVSNDGSLYLIVIPHTSGATFSAFATDGLGHNLYNLILTNPADMLPTGGTPGQRLVKSTSSPFETEWLDDHIRLNVFVEGMPQPAETLMQFLVVDHMTLPSGLIGSVIFQGIPSETSVTYTLFQNASAIGTITFNGPSPIDIVVAFAALVHCVPGDVLSLVAPAVPDAAQSNISFTFLATLTL